MRGGEYDAFVAREGSVRDFAARALGFDIAIVTISGEAELRVPEILADAGISPKNSLLFLDAAQARARLETVPLIKQASVRKLYPNHLVIDLVERAPYALWQKDGQVNIVAADGAVIDEMRDQRFANLPFVVGEGANERLPEFNALLAAAGELGPKIRAGVLVAHRRWNLKMTNGVDVMLPEINPQAAVATLVRLQRESRVLDRDVISLDLRLEGRMFARLTEEAAAARAAAAPKEGGARYELQTAHAAPAARSRRAETPFFPFSTSAPRKSFASSRACRRWRLPIRCAGARIAARCSASAISVRAASRRARSSISIRPKTPSASRSTRPSAWPASKSTASSSI